MTSDPLQALRAVRRMGARWAGKRALYELRRRTGGLERRCPLREWPHYVSQVAGIDLLSTTEPFPLRLPRSLTDDGPAVEVEEIRSGRLRLFGNDPVETGWPPRWLEEPGTGEPWAMQHWSRYESLGDRDVKVTWEPGRFAFTWPLLRAFAADRSSDAPELFWQAVDSFGEANPPNAGPHWMCGQEASVRTLALLSGLVGFRDTDATTTDRVARLAALLAATADRIEGNLAYAILQKNNHGILESLGLWLLGHALEGHEAAERWRDRGREVLASEAERQVYPDGAYVQHSLAYHRFAMEALTWAVLLGRSFGDSLDAAARFPLESLGEALFRWTDPETGLAPNYGSNDGSRLALLDGCSREDMRPSIQLALAVASEHRTFDPGPWDEPLAWTGLSGLDEGVTPPTRAEPPCESSGFVVIPGWETWALTRCTSYVDRPGQADMTHLDLWWKGHNLVADPGTCAYNAPPPWRNGLAATRAHNAVSVDGLDQMEKGPRFLWMNWLHGEVLRRDTLDDGRARLLRMEHDGYAKRLGITCRRAVLVTEGDAWIVVDDLEADGDHDGEHEISSQWLFPGATLTSPLEGGRAVLETPAGPCGFAAVDLPPAGDPVPVEVEVHVGDEDDVLGWRSLRYGHREPAAGLVARSRSALPARRMTILAPGGGSPAVSRDLGGIHVHIDDTHLVLEPSLQFVRSDGGDG